MNAFRLGTAMVVTFALVAGASAREWLDDTGAHRIEAKLVVVKEGKAYLEKSGGQVVPVALDKLSKADQEYLLTLPECRDYFDKNPIPGLKRPVLMAVIHVPDENKVGEVRRFGEMGWGVKSLAFSPDGGLLAAGKMDRAVMVFDVDKSTRTAFFEKLENLGEVTCAVFTPDGRKLLTGGYSGRIQIWDVGPGGTLTEANRFVGHSQAIETITISRDGKTVLSGGDEKKVRCWDLETCRERFAVEGFQGKVRATFLSKKAKQGLACDGETLALIDMQEGKAIQTMKLASYVAQALAIAPDGSRVVVSDSYALRMWEIRTGKEFPPLQDQEIQWTARFLPNSKYVLSGGQGKANLWEVATGRKLQEFDVAGGYYVQCLACSPDNRHFAALPGSAGQSLQVFRLPADVGK